MSHRKAPNPDQQWSNLNPLQRDGQACIWCNSTAQPMQPCGYSVTTGSQVFGCVGSCTGHLQAAAIMHAALDRTAPIDPNTYRPDELCGLLATTRVSVDNARAAIVDAEQAGIDTAPYRAELADISAGLVDLVERVKAALS